MKIEITISDKTIGFLKKYLSGKRFIGVAVILIIASSIMLYSEVKMPHIFSEGAIISAEQVNANFKILKEKFDLIDETTQSLKEQLDIVEVNYVALKDQFDISVANIEVLKDRLDINEENSKILTERLDIEEANSASFRNRLDIVEAKIDVVPIGTIVPFGAISTKVPEGWLLCDGRTVSRTEYSDLFSIIQINWGKGDEISTFNLPDLRGVVLRGGNTVGASVRSDGYKDPDFNLRKYISGGSNFKNNKGVEEKIGSFQMDENKEHSHTHTRFSVLQYDTGNGDGANRMCRGAGSGITTKSGGNESRGKNAAIHYIIKAKK